MIRGHLPPSRDGHGGPAWLLTFADLVALLLAFFVMMFAAQRVEYGSWQAMIESLSRSLNIDRLDGRVKKSAGENIEAVRQEPGVDLAYLEALIRTIRRTEPELGGIVLQHLSDRIVLSLPGDLLFGPGRADPIPAAQRRISLIANLLRNIPNQVDVFGHSDPSPVGGFIFESNWELSLARADSVAVMMQNAGYMRPIGAFGLSDTRFSDLDGIMPESRRRSLARRVDIVIRRSGDRK